MKKIPLTQGKVALVDDADYDWLNQWEWWAVRGTPSIFYARHSIGKQRYENMHRVILGLRRGDKRQCDHRDGNGLNNQRVNLRICSRAENQQNMRKRAVATSQYKGIYWDRCRHNWYSRIQVNKKTINLGRFYSETDAAAAYNAAALKHFGKFALLNTL